MKWNSVGVWTVLLASTAVGTFAWYPAGNDCWVQGVPLPIAAYEIHDGTVMQFTSPFSLLMWIADVAIWMAASWWLHGVLLRRVPRRPKG
ncbi:hypothetical protein SAMN05421753_111170 [Planctomicrobium piriforme]|uniref:Uncharacterized protein n=1 Tax=Planctomicrobium piriforme TaxID=1576369 RepID=A0A1I3KB85_9PLAN|nr:hypothetical protein SAMN05421753_111170 [Planctomicrobium piriforme]